MNLIDIGNAGRLLKAAANNSPSKVKDAASALLQEFYGSTNKK